MASLAVCGATSVLGMVPKIIRFYREMSTVLFYGAKSTHHKHAIYFTVKPHLLPHKCVYSILPFPPSTTYAAK